MGDTAQTFRRLWDPGLDGPLLKGEKWRTPSCFCSAFKKNWSYIPAGDIGHPPRINFFYSPLAQTDSLWYNKPVEDK